MRLAGSNGLISSARSTSQDCNLLAAIINSLNYTHACLEGVEAALIEARRRVRINEGREG